MATPIKLLIIHSRNIFEQDGANSNRWLTMIKGLCNHNVEIKIIFTQGYGSVGEFKKYGWKGIMSNITYSYSVFILHNTLWMRRISMYLLSPLLKIVCVQHVKSKIKEYKPEIIWLHPSLDVFDIFLDVIKNRNLPDYRLMIELNEYNDIWIDQATNKIQSEIAKRYSKVLINKILPKMDLLLIMTNQLMEHYKQFTDPSKAFFLHLPMTVDLKRFKLEKTTKERYIAYCGSSSFIKDGIDILIKSFSMISKKYPEVNLKIAAFMEADGQNMLTLIQEYNRKEHRIEYVGELKRDDIPDFITNAEILLLPRPNSLQAQGGFPTKLGEYLATGNPICATTVGEIPLYLNDNESVFFAEPGNINSFCEAMERALSDTVNSKRVGLNGLKVAIEHFNMDSQAKRLYEFLIENVN